MTNLTMTRDREADTGPKSDTSAARRAMVNGQLRPCGVNEEYILARMLAVPREAFLPADKAPLAYIDRTISLGAAGHLAAPLFYGLLLREAAPRADDSVLVVEGGTGYLAALLQPLVASLETISAATAVSSTGEPRYSLIVIDGAIEQLPEGLAARLVEGGRIVTGLILRQVTRLAVGRKIAGRVALQPVADLGIPVLHAFDAPKRWTFA